MLIGTPARRLFIALLLPLFLIGCGKEDNARSVAELGTGDIRWASFPVPLHADQNLVTDPTALTDLQAAMAYWEQKAGKQLFTLVAPWDSSILPYDGYPESPDSLLGNVLFLHPSWPFGPNVKGKTIVHSSGGTIESAVILIEANGHYCSGGCLGDTVTISRRKLIAHELGHFLGFGHSPSYTDLMYPEIVTDRTLDQLRIDTSLLEKLTK